MVKLNCLLLGQSFDDAFVVKIADSNEIRHYSTDIDDLNISELKFLIWNNKRDTIEINDPDNMTLWKVNITEEEESKLKNVEANNIEDILNGEKLKPTRMFRRYFPKGKRSIRSISPSVETRDSKKEKLDEEFSNICELVQHLRTSKDKAITAIDIDDDDIKVVSSGSKNTPSNIIRHPEDKLLAVIEKPAMYVRESYEDLRYRLIELASRGPKNTKHKFLVTGTSGVGKSCFLIYFLILHLCEQDVPIIFQSHKNKEVFYCFENLNLSSGSYKDFSTHWNSSETWYLADGIISPELVSAKTVIALSPKGVAKDKFQEIDKDIVKKFNMSPWTLGELSFCREHVFPEVPQDIMQELYYKAGGVPRYVFRRVEISLHYGSDPKIDVERQMIIYEAFERVQQALLLVEDFSGLLNCFTENAYFIQYSSHLVHRWADSSYIGFHLQWASRYIQDEIEKNLDKQSWKSLLERIQTMKEYPAARGLMFELYVIHLFRSCNEQFQMRELLEDPKPTSTPGHKKFSLNKPVTANIRTAAELASKNDNNIILPDTTNFGAADLFYTPDTIFQVTVSNNHPIKQAELVRIVENMPAYRKNVNALIYLVFVVPEDIYESYRYQDIVVKDPISRNFRRVIKKDKRLKHVQQWVLKIDTIKSTTLKDTIKHSLGFGPSGEQGSSK
ncbi:unnamed protein product [Rhizophagus irregularis]|nr:unnamed protein product [Rhizophagus irregularis]